MSHSNIPNIHQHQLSTRTIHLKRSDSTKASNLSLPLKQTSQQQQQSSSTSHHSRQASTSTTNKDSSLNNNNGSKEDIGFGLCIKGNKSTGRGVLVSKVEFGSPAWQNRLRPGDSILEINGQPFTSMHHEEAVKKCTQILKSEKFVSMTIKSPDLAGMKYNSFDESQLHHYPRDEELYIPVSAAAEMHSTQMESASIHSAPPQKVGCLWIDRHGRSVSPPHEYSHRRNDRMDRVRRIELLIEHGQSLGLMIRGGIEYGLGIFVTGVDKDSVAERAGLMVNT
jgi:whirlin